MLNFIESLSIHYLNHLLVIVALVYLLKFAVTKSRIYLIAGAYSAAAMIYSNTFGAPSHGEDYYANVYFALAGATAMESANSMIMMRYYRSNPAGFLIGMVSAVGVIINLFLYFDVRAVEEQVSNGSLILHCYYTTIFLLNLLVLSFSITKIARAIDHGLSGLLDVFTSFTAACWHWAFNLPKEKNG